jgi:hypothetical protein
MLDNETRKACVRAAKALRSNSGSTLVWNVTALVGLRRLQDAFRDACVRAGPDGLSLLWIPEEHRGDFRTEEHLKRAFHDIERLNPALDGSLTALWGGAPDDQVAQAWAELRSLDLGTERLLQGPSMDIVGEAYEAVQSEMGVKIGERNGEFFTPSSVVRMMVMMNPPEPGQRIIDPCVGSGRMLIEAAAALIRQHGWSRHVTGPDHPAGAGRVVVVPPPAFFAGQDLARHGPAMAKIGLCGGLGYFNAVLKTGDSLRDPLTAAEADDILVARTRLMLEALRARHQVPTAASSEAPATPA